MSQYRTPCESNDFYLPKEEFLTMVHFCLQYPTWEQQLKDISSLKSPVIRSNRVQNSRHSDTTADTAMKLARITRKMDMVDNTLKSLSSGIEEWLKLGVCEGLTYEQLRMKGIPCGSKLYYKIRQRFYYELAQKF